MPPIERYAIDVHATALRVKYTEGRRHVLGRLELDALDNWLLRPSTLGWWEDRDGLRYPLDEAYRETVIARIVDAARTHHRLWLNVSGRPIEPRPADWPGAPPVVGPSFGEFECEPGAFDPPHPQRPLASSPFSDEGYWIERIDAALEQIQPMADAGWAQAQSIARQLHWCRGVLRGEAIERAPGPLSMGLIATREFDMYGSQPELAALINDIEREMLGRGLP